MKKILCFSLCLTFGILLSQNTTLYKKDGTVQPIMDRNVQEATFGKLGYAHSKKDKYRTLDLDEIEKIVHGDVNYFPTAVDEKGKKIRLCKVIATSANKDLMIYYEPSGGSQKVYQYRIANKMNKTIEQGHFRAINGIKGVLAERNEAKNVILKQFSDCPQVVDRISEYETADSENGFMNFIYSDKTSICN